MVGPNTEVVAEIDPPRYGIAFSGGGHRAGLWAAGAWLALVDAGVNKQTVSIASVLGPTRNARQLRRMKPPAAKEWLVEETLGSGPTTADAPLFAETFQVGRPADLWQLIRSRRPREMADDTASLLAAASALEQSVNNTSLFLVLDARGTRLVFPGDSQQGAWDHVLDDPDSRGLVADAALYKIGHHGSHNGTPREFVEDVLGEGHYAMLPWGMVKAWQATIPKSTLIDALIRRQTSIIRHDVPATGDPRLSVDPNGMWTELTLTAGTEDA